MSDRLLSFKLNDSPSPCHGLFPTAHRNTNRRMSLPSISFSPYRQVETDPSRHSCPELIHPILDLESQGNQLEDVPGLVEHLFPDSVLPLSLELLSAELMNPSTSSQWDHERNTWRNLPYLEWYSMHVKAEQKLAHLLNQIGTALRQICSKFKVDDKIPAKPRLWEGERTKVPLKSDKAEFRKPDLTLTDGKLDSWSSVLASGEVQGEYGDYKHSLAHLTNAAFMIFTTQDERRFNIGVTFTVYDVRVYVFDRAGVVGSESFNFCENPTLFIRLLAGLTLTKRLIIGFDPTIIHEDNRRFVIVDGKKYEMVEQLFVSDAIRGRGTVCWRARRDGFDFVIKDTWADVARINTEPSIMRDVAGLDGVAQLIADEVVTTKSGEEDSTRHLREIIDRKTYHGKDLLEDIEIRVHRRIVSTPFGHELPHFSTQRELFSVLIDAITAHRRLVEKDILHRDISLGNLIMYRPGTKHEANKQEATTSSSPRSASYNSSEAVFRKGLLIDMDYAIYMTKNEIKDDGSHRTGTLPFMAIDLLKRDRRKHEPRHDLESFFYVLMWICWNYAGPNNVKRQNFDLSKTLAGAWMEGESYSIVGIQKAGFFMLEDNFEEFGLKIIAPYFRNLKPCLRELRNVIYKKTTQHEDVIETLRKTMDGLPDVENWSASDDEEGYGLRKGLKRTHDEMRSSTSDEDTNKEKELSAPPRKHPRSETTRPLPRHSTSRRTSRRAKQRLHSIAESKPLLPRAS